MKPPGFMPGFKEGRNMDLEEWKYTNIDTLAELFDAFDFKNYDEMIIALLNAGLNEYTGYLEMSRYFDRSNRES